MTVQIKLSINLLGFKIMSQDMHTQTVKWLILSPEKSQGYYEASRVVVSIQCLHKVMFPKSIYTIALTLMEIVFALF